MSTESLTIQNKQFLFSDDSNLSNPDISQNKRQDFDPGVNCIEWRDNSFIWPEGDYLNYRNHKVNDNLQQVYHLGMPRITDEDLEHIDLTVADLETSESELTEISNRLQNIITNRIGVSTSKCKTSWTKWTCNGAISNRNNGTSFLFRVVLESTEDNESKRILERTFTAGNAWYNRNNRTHRYDSSTIIFRDLNLTDSDLAPGLKYKLYVAYYTNTNRTVTPNQNDTTLPDNAVFKEIVEFNANGGTERVVFSGAHSNASFSFNGLSVTSGAAFTHVNGEAIASKADYLGLPDFETGGSIQRVRYYITTFNPYLGLESAPSDPIIDAEGENTNIDQNYIEIDVNKKVLFSFDAEFYNNLLTNSYATHIKIYRQLLSTDPDIDSNVLPILVGVLEIPRQSFFARKYFVSDDERYQIVNIDQPNLNNFNNLNATLFATHSVGGIEFENDYLYLIETLQTNLINSHTFRSADNPNIVPRIAVNLGSSAYDSDSEKETLRQELVERKANNHLNDYGSYSESEYRLEDLPTIIPDRKNFVTIAPLHEPNIYNITGNTLVELNKNLEHDIYNFLPPVDNENEEPYFLERQYFRFLRASERYTPQYLNTDALQRYPPPKGIKHLAVIDNSVFGINNQDPYYELRWSQPGNAHYWPPENNLAMSEKITGILQIAEGVLVFTDNETHLLIFDNTGQISRTLISNEQGCISPKSCKTIKNLPVWISKDGICTYTNGRIEVISRPFLAEGWLEGAFICAEVHDEQYHVLTTRVHYTMDFRYERISFVKHETSSDTAMPNPDATHPDDPAHIPGPPLYHPTVRYLVRINDKLYGIDYNTNNVVEMFAGNEYNDLHYRSGIITEGSATIFKRWNKIYITGEFDSHNDTIKFIPVNGPESLALYIVPEINVPVVAQGRGVQIDITGKPEIYGLELPAILRPINLQPSQPAQ